MATAEKRQWGVTNAISEAPPTEHDLKLNDSMIEELKRRNNFEGAEGVENRYVGPRCEGPVADHVQVPSAQALPEGRGGIRSSRLQKQEAASVHDRSRWREDLHLWQLRIGRFKSRHVCLCRLRTRLTVAGSDIDTLVIAPKDVNRDDFFHYFPPIFREMSTAEDITEFITVPDAFMPIIKMEYAGVPIDLLFVSLPQSSIPADFTPAGTNLVRGLNDVDVRALNGTRLKDELLALVPQVKSFRHATRVIKLWSSQRAIYGNVFGYPGGVAWAIMVARICQLYPFACGATIVSKFFRLMYEWSWPRPIMLQAIEEGQFGLKVWNPTVSPGLSCLSKSALIDLAIDLQ
jgi:poly(A) polymerase